MPQACLQAYYVLLNTQAILNLTVSPYLFTDENSQLFPGTITYSIHYR